MEVTAGTAPESTGGSAHALLLPVGAVYRGSGQEANPCAKPQVGHNGGAEH